MVTSSGRPSVGQGTSPVQSGRRIRCKTSPEVRSPLPGCRFRLSSDLQNSPHTVKKRKDSSRWRAQATTKRADSRNVRLSNDRYEATGLGVRPKRESSIRHTERTIRIEQGHGLGSHVDPDCEATGICVKPKRESSTRHAERSTIRVKHKDVDKDGW